MREPAIPAFLPLFALLLIVPLVSCAHGGGEPPQLLRHQSAVT